MRSLRLAALGMMALPAALVWIIRKGHGPLCRRLMLLHGCALIVIAMAVALGVARLTLVAADVTVPGWWPASAGLWQQLSQWLGHTAAWLLGLISAILTILWLAQTVAMPLVEHLSSQLETTLFPAAIPPQLSLWRGVVLGLTDLGAASLVAIVWTIPQLLLTLIFPPAGAVLGLLLVSLGWAQEFVTLPLARRGLSYRQRLRWLLAHWPAALSFGCLANVMLFCPLCLLFALPLLGAAGTWLWARIYEEEGALASKLTRSDLSWRGD